MTDVPSDLKLQPIGSRSDVVASIAELFPETDFAYFTWFSLHTEDARAEMIVEGDPVEIINLRGPSLNVIEALAERFGCRVYDTSTGDFMDVE